MKKKLILGTFMGLFGLLSMGVVTNAATFIDGLYTVEHNVWKSLDQNGTVFYTKSSADVYSWEYGTPKYHYQRAQSVVTITGAVRSDSQRVYSRGYGVATTPSPVTNNISFSSRGYYGY